MKKFLFLFIIFFVLKAQAKLSNCNTCKGGCNLNQTCCFLVNCPEECNPYSCNGYCPGVSDPKCIYDPCSGKYLCICR